MVTTEQRICELWAKGYQCSQIILIMGLDARGQNNPVLVKAVAGLAWGCGEGSCTCGALTGACCLLSLFTGKGYGNLGQQKQLVSLTTELVRWFWQKYGFPLGGIDCMAIREAALPEKPNERCQKMMQSIYEKVSEIIIINKLDAYWGDCHFN
jgi:C_GCAxxG_C_C family probable redox protein